MGLIVNIQIDPHDIAALGVSNGSNPAGVFNLSNIPRILKMVHYFC